MTISNSVTDVPQSLPTTNHQQKIGDHPDGQKPPPMGDTRFPYAGPGASISSAASGGATEYAVLPDLPVKTLTPQEMSDAVASWGNVFNEFKNVTHMSSGFLKPSVNPVPLLKLPHQDSAPKMSPSVLAAPVIEEVLTPAETKALSALQNALIGAGTKGAGLTAMHMVEKVFLKSPEILSALAKKYPCIKTAAGYVPHPFVRTLGLVLPWTLEPILTEWMRNKLGYKDPDPKGEHAPPDLAPASTLLNWNGLQPWINQVMKGKSEVAQAAAAFAGTFAINAVRDFVSHLLIEWNKQHPPSKGKAPSPGVTPPTAKEKTQAGILSTAIRGPLELARQLQNINPETFPHSAALNKFLTDYWPGLIPAAMVYLQAELARGLSKHHAAASDAASQSQPPEPPAPH